MRAKGVRMLWEWRRWGHCCLDMYSEGNVDGLWPMAGFGGRVEEGACVFWLRKEHTHEVQKDPQRGIGHWIAWYLSEELQVLNADNYPKELKNTTTNQIKDICWVYIAHTLPYSPSDSVGGKTGPRW